MVTQVLFVLALTCSLGLGFILGRERERRLRLPADTQDRVGRIRHHLEYRAAIHEAGHTVCAWFDPFLRRIPEVSIETGQIGNGWVHHIRSGGARSDALWYIVVVHLGGIAAEVSEFKKFRSGTAEEDLQKALAAARTLAERGDLAPPWSEPLEPDDFGMAKVYGVAPNLPEVRILDLAYGRAKFLVTKDRVRMQRVVVDLMEKGVLRDADIRAIFGYRMPLFTET